MPFDTKRYDKEYLLGRDLKQGLSDDDLLERYAIDLGASEAEVAARVKAVRVHWNGHRAKPGSRLGPKAMLCVTADEQLVAEHGDQMLQRSWWLKKAEERKKKAAESVGKVGEELKGTYGGLGAVAQASLDAAAASYGLTAQEIGEAAREAGLKVVGARPLPEAPMQANQFEAIEIKLNVCGARTIPALLHPDCGEFRILDGFESLADARLRLDLPAVVTQLGEVEKKAPSESNNARREVLQILKTAAADGVDLTDLALAHLVDLGRETIQRGQIATLDRLTALKVERDDAAMIVALLADEKGEAGAAGEAAIDRLLREGRLGEARQTAESIPEASGEARAKAMKKVAAARARVDGLIADIRAAIATDEEQRASSLVKELQEISADDAEEVIAAVPLGPVEGLRLVADADAVKLHWRPTAGHGDDTTYVVTRSEGGPPTSLADGREVARTAEVTAVDNHAPVASSTFYSVFATTARRPSSRPASGSVTILPPIGSADADVGPDEITARWSAHPACVGVEVHRTAPGAAPQRVQAEQNSCRLTGLPEGVPVHLEVAAIYRDPSGNVLRSATTHIDATPRSAAKPLPKLRGRPVEADGEVRVRVSWAPVDSSEVRILVSPSPPPWAAGTWISQEQLAQFAELTGRRSKSGAETTFDAEVEPGVHHLFAVSVGGTGIVCGASTTVGVTAPIRNPVVTPFGTYATVSWEWPATAQVAEVRTEVDDEVELFEVTQAEYRNDGGAKVRLGATHCKVEIRAMIHTGSGAFASPPVKVQIDERNEAEISYAISSSGLGRRSKRVTFSSASGCSGVPVQVVVAQGSVMPISADDKYVLLEERLDLSPGSSAAFKVTVPKAFSKPRWVRCFVVGGNARLLDPPISDLKD